VKLGKQVEKRLLEVLRDDYYVNASLSYAAKRAGVSYRDALDYISEHDLPFCGDEDEIGRQRTDKMLSEMA